MLKLCITLYGAACLGASRAGLLSKIYLDTFTHSAIAPHSN